MAAPAVATRDSMARAIASDRAFFFSRVRFNKRKSASRADIFSRTMAAASGSSTFLAPGAAPLRRSPARSARGRVRTTPTAKGQKGVRRVVSSPGQEQFPPGSTLGKMMNLRLNTINWRVLNDAADKLEGELASQPILGLVKAETLLRGVDALEKEGRGYREYILLRSLGLKMWFTHATSRGGVSDPRTRCAVGKALASPDGEFNIYRRILTHAPLAKAGNWEAFADGLAADARAAANAATEDDLRTTKVRYDAAVTAAHFEFVDAEIAAAARVIEQGFENPDDALVSAVALVPWMDPGDAPARASATGGEAAAAAADEPEDDVESMFGKKKKKKMPSRVLRAATPSAAKNEATTAVFRDGLEKTLGKLVKKQAEPTFPETSAWNVGEKQATGSDAVAAAVAICLRLPPACVIVVPTDVFASALTFDLGVLGLDKRVVSAAAFVAEESEEANENENAVLLAFDPAAPGADAALAAAAARRRRPPRARRCSRSRSRAAARATPRRGRRARPRRERKRSERAAERAGA